MESDEHAADIARIHLALGQLLPETPGRQICHCGREIQIGEDHGMCWPGM